MTPATLPGLRDAAAEEFASRERLASRAIEEIREHAFGRFVALGWPGPRDEAWRHTPVAAIAATPFHPLDGGPPPALDADPRDLAMIGRLEGLRIVFANGHFSPDLSRIGGEPRISIESLRQAIARAPEEIEAHLLRSLPEEDAFTFLNAAFLTEGAVITVPDGVVVREPIHVVFLAASKGAAPAIFPRNILRVGRNAQATIVHTYAGAGKSLTDAVTRVEVGENAQLALVTIQRQGKEASHVGLTAAEIGRAGRFSRHLFSIGSAVSRDVVHARLSGEGAECALDGLFMTEGDQHADLVTIVDHAMPHGTSRQTYKGILDGRSRGAFTGRVIVRPDAQKTDAQQSNKNLLLSREALVNSTPALEIRANDVKCKHGSTTGQLDENALFYLRSRGLSEGAARTLLTYAFASELVRRVPAGGVRADIDGALHERLPEAPGISELAR
jgi:Fe-S cluster assembly protein SufD